MEDRERKALIELEDKMIRRLRFLVNLTFATIAQDDSLTLEQAWEHVLGAQRRGGRDVSRQGSDLRPPLYAALFALAGGAIRRQLSRVRLHFDANPVRTNRAPRRFDRSRGAYSSRRSSPQSSIQTTTSSDYILPGFVDLQVNGSHGVDVMTASADGIMEISRPARARGHHGMAANRNHLADRSHRESSSRDWRSDRASTARCAAGAQDSRHASRRTLHLADATRRASEAATSSLEEKHSSA